MNWSSRNTQAAAKEEEKSMLVVLLQLAKQQRTNKQTNPPNLQQRRLVMRLITDHPNMVEGHHGCLKIIIIIGGDGGDILLHVKSMATFLSSRRGWKISFGFCCLSSSQCSWVFLVLLVLYGVSASSSSCSSSCIYVCV